MDPYHAIKRRFAWLLSAFVLALAYFAGSNLWQSLGELRDAQGVAAIGKASVVLGGTIHELQRERGLSSGYLASSGKRFRDALKTQHIQTELALKKISPALATMHVNPEPWGLADVELLREIEAIRKKSLDLSIERSGAVAIYTQLIDLSLIHI